MYEFRVRTCQYTHAMSVVGNIVLANFFTTLSCHGYRVNLFWCSLLYLHYALVQSKISFCQASNDLCFIGLPICLRYKLNKSYTSCSDSQICKCGVRETTLICLS